jgi:hypothetical protein
MAYIQDGRMRAQLYRSSRADQARFESPLAERDVGMRVPIDSIMAESDVGHARGMRWLVRAVMIDMYEAVLHRSCVIWTWLIRSLKQY